MDKWDGSSVWFETRSKGLKVEDVIRFFSNHLTPAELTRLVTYYKDVRCNYIRVHPNYSGINVIDWNTYEFSSISDSKRITIPVKKSPTESERITELENRVKELEEQLNSKTSPVVKVWKPKKDTKYVNLHLNKVFTVTPPRTFGDVSPELTYQTSELANNALKALMLHATLLKYHSEFCPDYKPDWKNEVKKYTVAFDNDENEYKVDWKYRVNSLTDVYFPEDIARFLVDKLNSSEVVLSL